jgi:hypothetical protein
MLALFNILNLVSYEFYVIVIFRFSLVKYMGQAYGNTIQ